jgi:hypothetical protein
VIQAWIDTADALGERVCFVDDGDCGSALDE